MVLTTACGPNGPAGETSAPTEATATGQSTVEGPSTGVPTTSGDPSTTEAPTTGTTEELEPCGEVHEGDLYVGTDTDLTSLANLGRVTKALHISMGPREQPDLSFLPCLHTVDAGLTIEYNLHLETTKGLVSLKKIGSLRVEQNPHLREIVGFEQIEELGLLSLHLNQSLEEIHVESLHTVEFLTIGRCEFEEPSAFHLALTDLQGFSGLTEVGTLWINGNEALKSVDLLDALAMNGMINPPVVQVRFNPMLPEGVIHDKLDALGVIKREVCGNQEGDPECFCLVGE